MEKKAEAVPDGALRLPAAEREEIAERLLASLDAAWVAEAERRLGELRRGQVAPLPWAQVKAAARRRTRGGE